MIEAIIDYEPEQLDLDGKLWTRRTATELVRSLFGVSYNERGMGKLLRRMGLSFQRPDRRAIEANPEAMAEWVEVMAEWVEVTYPALAGRAECEAAMILFADQVGVRPDHLSVRPGAGVGQTPTVARTGKRFSLNAMSAISPRG